MVENSLRMDEVLLKSIDARMEELKAQGVTINEEPTGELNFSGCHRGYCQAWD